MRKSINDLYDPEFVSGMFDRMSKTYGFANLITSFGFTSRWRKQCIQQLPKIKESAYGYDLMSGMGEAWTDIQTRLKPEGLIIAVDISDEMNKKAGEHLKRLKVKKIRIEQKNVLKNDIPSDSADFIISTFGLKTFDKDQQKKLAIEISRILKPGGSFSLIEISEPKILVLKWFYMFYLKYIIPLIGKIFLGNTDDYRMLGMYCQNFKISQFFHSCLLEQNLNSTFKNYFFGCASGVFGKKEIETL
ncbi:class I SAM-dependent methyltransferase [Algoriphagus pacificus]|uniref:Class I SAM-dependent methyltransferase n=1 Tax=Algoriphagus pacificus TaxID=2811234 RepID=A0ABS3CDX2_9BACT|nr:class I SAM-dependent methyltransferase [Algoriphagus pacificus]MBN7815307.1 class I SAM-dependent methyltransferase [Algoriphagus pacificus]